jgi:hypothetical protein
MIYRLIGCHMAAGEYPCRNMSSHPPKSISNAKANLTISACAASGPKMAFAAKLGA